MMKYLLLILFALAGITARGQQNSDRILSDTSFSYKVTIPDWLNVRDTGSKFAWGGAIPKVNGIENVILVKAFGKEDHKDMAAFENYVVGSWTFTKPTNWSEEHLCYGKKDLDPIPGLGKAFRVSLIYQKKVYTCQYVLAETKTAFLWIDFTSTPDLYPINLGKFKELLAGIKLL